MNRRSLETTAREQQPEDTVSSWTYFTESHGRLVFSRNARGQITVGEQFARRVVVVAEPKA